MRNPRKRPFQRAERRDALYAVEPPSVCRINHQLERSRPRHLFVEEPVASNDVAITWQVSDPTIVDAETRGQKCSAHRDQESADGYAPRTRPTGQETQRRRCGASAESHRRIGLQTDARFEECE